MKASSQHRSRLIAAALTASLATTLPAMADQAADQAIDQQLQEYRQAMQTFGKTLKGELQAAMQEGGALAAVNVCHERAPEIASNLSEATGFTLRRTSLKPRATTPTDWERAVLEDFESRHAAGEAPGTIEWHEVAEVDGEHRLRFMKAIETQEVCLTCHGQKIDPALKAKINQLYPEDQATGFQKGDIRGAFSIIAAIDD